MRDLLEEIAELKAENIELRGKLDNGSVEYTYDDYDQLGGRTVSKMSVDNCHELMDMDLELKLIGVKQFKDSLAFAEKSGHYTIYAGRDKIKIKPDQRGVMQFMLGKYGLTGKHKLVMVKEIMMRAELMDTKRNGEWDMYIIRYNTRMYSVGFMLTDEGNTVTFMKDYKQYKYEPTAKEYYDEYRKKLAKGRTQVHNSTDMNDVMYLQQQLDDAIGQVEYWEEMIKDTDPYIGGTKDQV